MTKDFFAAVRDRRSYYSLENKAPISDEKIKNIVTEAIKYAPSPFNCQSARAVLLLATEHKKLWDIVKAQLRKVNKPEDFVNVENKINSSFASGYGTVLFFEDMSVVEGLQKRFTLYKDNFPLWSHQSSGMFQFIVWTALEVEGFGASLQHYNPLIDNEIKATWKIADDWKLLSQMPFGLPIEKPQEKDFSPLDQRVKIFE